MSLETKSHDHILPTDIGALYDTDNKQVARQVINQEFILKERKRKRIVLQILPINLNVWDYLHFLPNLSKIQSVGSYPTLNLPFLLIKPKPKSLCILNLQDPTP